MEGILKNPIWQLFEINPLYRAVVFSSFFRKGLGRPAYISKVNQIGNAMRKEQRFIEIVGFLGSQSATNLSQKGPGLHPTKKPKSPTGKCQAVEESSQGNY